MLPDNDFWGEEEKKLWAALSPVVLNVLLSGANGGMEQLPPELSILINWDVFNRSAIDYLNGYRLGWVKGISDTTRKQAIDAINDWIKAGEPLPALQSKLALILGESRANAIAVTEVTRIFAAGNMNAWQSTGVVSGSRWMTAQDNRVTPLCRALDGQIADINGVFRVPDSAMSNAGVAKMVAQWGREHKHPPAHIRCRSWIQPVVSNQLFDEQLVRILQGGF